MKYEIELEDCQLEMLHMLAKEHPTVGEILEGIYRAKLKGLGLKLVPSVYDTFLDIIKLKNLAHELDVNHRIINLLGMFVVDMQMILGTDIYDVLVGMSDIDAEITP